MPITLRQLYAATQFREGDTVWKRPLRQAAFRGQTGWVIGDTQLLYSYDAGKNWRNVFRNGSPLRPGRQEAISVPDESTCVMIIGQHKGSRCIQSTDEGGSWNVLFSSTAIRLTAVCFLTRELGFLAGHTDEGLDPLPIFLKTEDEGKNWRNCDFPFFSWKSCDGQFLNPTSLNFSDPENGCMTCVTGLNESVVYLTDDGGRYWKPNDRFQTQLSNCLPSRRSGDLVLCGSDGFISARKKGSANWTRISLGTKAFLNYISETDWGYYVVGDDYDDDLETTVSTIFFSEQIKDEWSTLLRSTDHYGLFYIQPHSRSQGVFVSGDGVFAYE